MRICLDLGSLQPRLDCKGSLEEVESSSHLTDASVVTSHVIEGHSLAEFIVLTELLRLLE